MQKTFIFSNWLSCITFLIFFSFTHAQCPSNFNDWTHFNRVIYDGNWLIGNNGSLVGSVGYADATPQRQELSTSDSNDGFGLNDYTNDTNYNGTGSDSFVLPLPLPNSSVIRVGK